MKPNHFLFQNPSDLLLRHLAIGRYSELHKHVALETIHMLVLSMSDYQFMQFSNALEKGRKFYSIEGGKQE